MSTNEYLSLNGLMRMLTIYNKKAHQAEGISRIMFIDQQIFVHIIDVFPKCRSLSEVDFCPGSPNLYVISNGLCACLLSICVMSL